MKINSSINNDDIGNDELAQLIKNAKREQGEALEELCRFVYVKIFGYTYYRVRQREDAEDLTSEVLLKVVRSLKTQKGNFLAWIYRIANNTIIDFYRKRGRHPEISFQTIEDKIPAQEPVSPFLTEKRIKKALSCLTPEQADVITLRFIQGHNNEEVAKIMGKTVGAVKVLQFRALKTLREFLRKEGYGTEDR
jgi:RNA polymerase sigma-70 factor (ECF subfamily)